MATRVSLDLRNSQTRLDNFACRYSLHGQQHHIRLAANSDGDHSDAVSANSYL
jgi:hypothetical protein